MFAALLMLMLAVGEEDVRFTKPASIDAPAEFKADFADRVAWEKRAEVLRQRVLVSQGLWPMPPAPPMKAVIHGAIDRGDYTVEKVFFASLPGHYVTGNLYRPTKRDAGAKLPAVLCPYGHWPNGRFNWSSDEKVQAELKSGAEKTAEGARAPLQARCAMLARMGCVVFHYDMVGYGDSKKIEHRQGFTDAEAILRLQSFMGLQTWNSIRAVDFVLTLPEVDPTRIAITGASGGATQCILAGACDWRISASFPVVMVSMNMQGGCVCENAPLLRVGTNNVELASLFAPRPLGAAAAQDWTSDFETRGLPEMKAVWKLFDRSDDVEGKFFAYPHNYNLHSREMMYAFMNRHLKLGLPEPVREKPFEPIEPKQLSVFEAEHPEPGDSGDAKAVREWMTRTSAEQMEVLKKDRDAHLKTLGVALRAIVADELPTAVDVEAKPPLTERGKWEGWIARNGSGERVPARVVFPSKWNGQVIIAAGLTTMPAKLLDSGAAVVTIDTFMSGEFNPHTPATQSRREKSSPNPRYVGIAMTYNRSVLANRVHDLLTAIAWARGWEGVKSVHLLARGDAGPGALLAKAIAGESVWQAAIDLNGFDFDRIEDDIDPMLLPGGLKYGGMKAFASLCGESTFITNAADVDVLITKVLSP